MLAEAHAPGPTRIDRRAVLTALAVAAASFAVYATTATRHPWWGDSPEFVTVAHTLGIAHPSGYPLYTLLSALAIRIPLGTPFLRLSLLSGVFAALASAVAAATVWVITGLATPPDRPSGSASRVAASLLAGLLLAFSQTLWLHATVPEVYSLSALLVLLVLLLASAWIAGGLRASRGGGGGEGGSSGPLAGDRPVVLIGLVLGLALAHHLTALLVVPSVGLALLFGRRERPSRLSALAALGLLAAGLTLYAYLPIRAGQDPPVLWGMTGSARSFLRHVSGQPYSSRLFDAPLGAVLQKLALFARALPGELPWLAIALSGAGLWALWRRSRVLLAVLTTEAVLVLAHAMSYRIRDIESYYIPVYAVLALAAGVGLFAVADVLGRARGRIAAAAPIVALVIALVLPLVPLTTGWRARDLSDRRDVSTYLDRMLSEIAPNGIVVALEDNIVFPLWYARFVEGRRTDVAVVDFVSRAPHLEKWFPGIRFPTEQELAEALAESTGAGGSASTVAETRVVEYLPLFVSLNAGPRPIYLDPAVAAKRLPSRSVPRGLLAQVVEDSTRARAAAREGGLLWETYLGTTAVGEERSPETARSYGRALADQGGLWLARGKPEEALALLEAAVKLAPNVAHIRNNLGAAYERSGRPADALSEYRRALELDAGAPVTYRNIYVVLRNRGDLEEAREFLVIASRLDPGNVDDLLELAALSEQLGEPDEARPIYEEAERLAPDSWEVQAAFGDYLTRIERYPAALAYFERAAARSLRSARVQRGLARCHWALGAPDLAIEAMRRSVELAPSDASATYDLAVMLVRTESPDEALAHLDRALSLEPRLWPARALKAGILTDAGRHEEARRAFERARRDGAGGRAFWTAWLNLERSAGDSVAARALLDSLARAGAAPRKGHAGTPAPRQDGP